MLKVVFPDGKVKQLSKDPDYNWIFDINDGDFSLAVLSAKNGWELI